MSGTGHGLAIVLLCPDLVPSLGGGLPTPLGAWASGALARPVCLGTSLQAEGQHLA